VLVPELQLGLLEEPLPTDPIDPFSHPLVAVGVTGIDFHDLFDGLNRGWPARRLVGDVGYGQLGERGNCASVRDLAAYPEGNSVAFGTCHGHGRAHGVAVAAEHAALVSHCHGFHVIHLGRLDGRGGTSGDGQRDLADFAHPFVLDEGRLAVHPEDGDVGAVHGAAHVETAGQGDSHLSRHPHTTEVIVEFIQHRLDDTGGVDGRGVTVDPALGVDDVGDAGAGAADGELVAAGFELAALQVVYQWLQFGLVIHHELYVIPGGEAQIAVAVLVGDLAGFADQIHTHQPDAAYPDGIDFSAGF